jgi:hypothetical protein
MCISGGLLEKPGDGLLPICGQIWVVERVEFSLFGGVFFIRQEGAGGQLGIIVDVV